MTMLRQPYYELSPEIYNALVQASKALENCALEPTLTELIYLRVSQINGCAFCLEMHSKALRKSGVAQAKTGCAGRLAGESPLQRAGTCGAGVGRIGHSNCH